MASEQCEHCKDKHTLASLVLMRCTLCNRFFHPDCLNTSLPTSLLGDSFFSLVCSSCSSSATAVLTRGRVSWLTATVLALYNLHRNGTPCNEGFFHWRNDICRFVNDNWSVIFGSSVKKKKTWPGSVSSCLSGNAGTLFESGLSQLKEQGWWKMISLDHPFIQMKNFVPKSNTSILARKLEIPEFSKSLICKRAQRNGVGSLANAIALKQKRDSLSYIPTVKKTKALELKRKSISNEGEEAKHTKLTDDNLTHSDSTKEGSKVLNEVLVTYQNKQLHTKCRIDESNLLEETSTPKIGNNLKLETDLIDSPHSSASNTCFSPNLIFSSYDIFNDNSPDTSSIGDNDDFIEDSFGESENTFKDSVSKRFSNLNELSVINLLGNSNDDCHDNLAELDDSSIDTLASDGIGNSSQDFLVEMFGRVESVNDTECETKTNQIADKVDAPVVYLEPDKKEANIDAQIIIKKHNTPDTIYAQVKKENPEESLANEKERNILDRFQVSKIQKVGSLVVTGTITNFIHSSYSLKKLKPYIRRDVETIPAKLKINRALQSLNKNNPDNELLHPIDFCYVQPNHIPAVNTLASLLFWPGIDVTEVLKYPDFSCVVLYKRLCIGLAFLVPDTRWNESYLSYFGVHPDWKNSGIGTFMLYHIIQTNMGKDITLHVSANNPAVLLYQKFGFKVEEFVRDFYDKYLPENSNECKHALFLRLSR